MVELFLNCFQVIKDVCVVEFKVVEDQCLWVVVNKFGVFVEEGVVIFVGFNDEEWVVVQVCGDVEIVWNVVNYEFWFIVVGFKDSGCYVGSGGFVVGFGDGQYLVIVQYEVVQLLWVGYIGNIIFQYCFNVWVVVSYGVIDNYQVWLGFQLVGVIVLN